VDDKEPGQTKPAPPSLTAAIRRARVEGAEQNQAVADLRQAEIARLEILEEAVRPIVEQAPHSGEMFDMGIAHGERPRLFIDMIGFIEMAHDRRSYRFLQDTRHGRVLIAETDRVDRIVAAVTNYVARRLVERERALASDWRSLEANPQAADTRERGLRGAQGAEPNAPAGVRGLAEANRSAAPPARRREGDGRARAGWTGRFGDFFTFVLLTLGSVTFILLLCLAVFALWEFWLRGLLGGANG